MSSSKSTQITVGAFVITEKRIGAGKFAKVYFGRHRTEGFPVAVKAIDRRLVPETNVFAEVRELSKLQEHPNIIRLYDTHQNDKYVCAVLEFCAGGDLKNAMDELSAKRRREARALQKQKGEDIGGEKAARRKGGDEKGPTTRTIPSQLIDEFTVRRLGAQLIDTLCFLNAKHVLHRDLKPANLLLTDKDLLRADLRVADLGFARGTGNGADMLMTSFIGTAYYMAPERLRNLEYDFQAEVWAAGLILYEMMYGEHPFSASGFMDLAEKIKSKGVVFPSVEPEPSDAFKDLIKRMIVEDPQARICIEDAKSHPWFAVSIPTPPNEAPTDERDVDTPLAGTTRSDEEDSVPVSPPMDAAVLEEEEEEAQRNRNATRGDTRTATTGADKKVESADAGTSPLRTTTNSSAHRGGGGLHTDESRVQSAEVHVDPSSFSVPLMHDEAPQQVGRDALPPSAPPPPSKAENNQQQRVVNCSREVNASFVDAFSLPPAVPGVCGASFASCGSGFAGGVMTSSSVGSHNGGGSLSDRLRGCGLSPVPSSMGCHPSSFTHPSLQAASIIYQPVPLRRCMERAGLVKWAAENHPQQAAQVQLYQYAGLVAANFEPTSPSATGDDEVRALREECASRAKLIYGAIKPDDRHALPKGACAFATARLWMHALHDSRVVGRLLMHEMEVLYRAAAMMCDIVSEDPTTEVELRNQAGVMRDLISSRWQRIVDETSPLLLFQEL